MYIEEKLNKYVDIKYKKFQEKICFTKYEIIGIKIPILRKIMKELLKIYDYQDIFNNLNEKYYEHVMLKGMIIAKINTSYEEKLLLIENFLPLIDNWAICDTFVSDLKFIKNYQEEFLIFINNILKRKKEYFQRFAIVCLLNYYINNQYVDYVLNTMLTIKSDDYYVKMAISWCISIVIIKYFDKGIAFLNQYKNVFDQWTYNKIIQKAMDSYQISAKDKELLKKMKLS